MDQVHMKSRLGKWLVVMLLVIATGGHWAVLQSVAWVGMFVNYSQTAPVAVAIQKTFDGKHPCRLCMAVQAGKQSQKNHEMQKLEKKMDFWLVRDASMPVPESPFFLAPFQTESPQSRAEAPATPPPRPV